MHTEGGNLRSREENVHTDKICRSVKRAKSREGPETGDKGIKTGQEMSSQCQGF